MKILEYLHELLSATVNLVAIAAVGVLALYYAHDKEAGKTHPLASLRQWARRLLGPLLARLRGAPPTYSRRHKPGTHTQTHTQAWRVSLSRDEQGLPAISPAEVEAADGDIALHGRSVADPFQCLEDLHSERTQAFIDSELRATEDYLRQPQTHSLREKLVSRCLAAQAFESIENPVSLGGTYFFFKRLQPELPQFSLFATKDLNAEARLVFDPNTLRVPLDAQRETVTQTGTHIATQSSALPAHAEGERASEKEREREREREDPSEGMLTVHATWISGDGQRLVYGYTRSAASTSLSLGVRDLHSGADLSDRLTGCVADYTTVAWAESRSGFFYTTVVLEEVRPGERVFAHRVLFHRLGSAQREDAAVFETHTHTPSLSLGVRVTWDGHYLLLTLRARQHARTAYSAWAAVGPESAQCFSDNTTANLSHTRSSGGAPAGNKLYYFDLSRFDARTPQSSLGACVRLVDSFAHTVEYLANIEDEFWLRTDYRAPLFRVVRVTLPTLSTDTQSQRERERAGSQSQETEEDAARVAQREREAYQCLQAWRTAVDWIPTRTDGAMLVGGAVAAHTVLVLKYAHTHMHIDTHSAQEVLLYDLTEELVAQSRIPVAALPHPAYCAVSGPHCSFYSAEIFYRCSDPSDPGSIYRALIDRDPYTGSIEISFSQVNATEIPGTQRHEFEVRQTVVCIPQNNANNNNSINNNNNGNSNINNSSSGTPSRSQRASESTLSAVKGDALRVLLFAHRSVFDVDSESESESEGEKELDSEGESESVCETERDARRAVVHSLRRESSLSPVHLRTQSQRTPRPCIVCVSSGFGATATPTFSLPLFLFAQHCRGLVVFVNIPTAHTNTQTQAQHPLQHAVDQLLEVLRYLVAHRYTTYAQLALYGGALTGAVLGAAIAQAPMLCQAVVLENALLDLLKMHRSGFNPPLFPARSGVCAPYAPDVDPEAWRSCTWYAALGAAEESEAALERLLSLSPLHNLQRLAVASSSVSTYPAVLCCTDLASACQPDSEVVSCKHSLKFVAQLQRCLPQLDCKRKPLLLYVNEWERDMDDDENVLLSRAYTEPSVEDIASKFAFILRNISATWDD